MWPPEVDAKPSANNSPGCVLRRTVALWVNKVLTSAYLYLWPFPFAKSPSSFLHRSTNVHQLMLLFHAGLDNLSWVASSPSSGIQFPLHTSWLKQSIKRHFFKTTYPLHFCIHSLLKWWTLLTSSPLHPLRYSIHWSSSFRWYVPSCPPLSSLFFFRFF